MEYKEIKFLSKGALFSSLGSITGAALGYLYLLMLARLLGPYWLGVYAIGVTIIQGAALISQLGFPFSLLRFIPIYRTTDDHSSLKGLFWFSLSITLVVSCLAALLLTFGAKFISQIFIKDDNFIRPLQFFSLAVPLLSIHALMSSMLRGTKNIGAMVFIQCLPDFLIIVLFLVFLRYFTMDIFAAILACSGAYFFAVALGSKMLFFRLPYVFKKEITMKVDTAKILLYSLPLLFFEGMRSFFIRTDVLMIGYFLSAKMAGLYSPALQLSFLVSFGLYMFNQPFAPLISEYYHHKKIEELAKLYKTTTRWVFMIGFSCFLFLILFGKEMLQLFGENFVQAYPALIILSAGQLINAGVGSAGLSLIMTGYQRFVFITTVCANIINIVFNLILIPRLGITGAAIATAAAVGVFNIMNLSYVKVAINIQPYTIKFYKPLVSGGVSFLAVFVIKHLVVFANYIVALVILGGLFFITFVLLSAALRFEEQEKYIFAFAVGQVMPSDDYKKSMGRLAKTEGHLEAYYRIFVNRYLSISPDFQYIWNPFGKDIADDTSGIFVGGMRAQVDF